MSTTLKSDNSLEPNSSLEPKDSLEPNSSLEPKDSLEPPKELTSNRLAPPKPKLARMLEVRRVFQRYDLLSLLDDLDLPRGARFAARLSLGRGRVNDLPRGLRLRRALEDLGPVFVKLGQALSTRPDLLPADIATELAKLQDEVPPFNAEHALRIIKAAYGDELDKIFSYIDPQPLASASVAQVHAATLQPGLAIAGQARNVSSAEPTGTATRTSPEAHNNVVIKVLRPGIEATVRSDLQVMHFMAKLLQKYWSRGRQFRPQEVVQEYEHTILGELDLRVEAAHGARMGANFEEQDIIYVPRIYWDYTHRNVLVMERIYGMSMRNLAQIRAAGVDLQKLAADGVNVFFKQAFEDNFFHADMHSGNIFVSEEGKWIAIDFGIMGTLSNADKHYLAEILLGFFNRDYARITRAHFRSGWIPADTKPEEFELAIRVVCEPIFAKPLSDISFGRVLMELFKTVRRFEMPVQPQLVLLYKTLLNIEGLGRQLYPDLNLWDTAKPFLEKWMKEQLSPKALLDDLVTHWPYLRQELLSKAEQFRANAASSSTALDAQEAVLRLKEKSAKERWFYVGAAGVALGLMQGFLAPTGIWAAPVFWSLQPLELIASSVILFSLWRISRT